MAQNQREGKEEKEGEQSRLEQGRFQDTVRKDRSDQISLRNEGDENDLFEKSGLLGNPEGVWGR